MLFTPKWCNESSAYLQNYHHICHLVWTMDLICPLFCDRGTRYIHIFHTSHSFFKKLISTSIYIYGKYHSLLVHKLLLNYKSSPSLSIFTNLRHQALFVSRVMRKYKIDWELQICLHKTLYTNGAWRFN